MSPTGRPSISTTVQAATTCCSVTTTSTDRRRIRSQPRHRLHCRLRHRRRLRHRLRPVANLSDTAIGPTASSEGPKLQATSRPGGGTSSPPLAPPASAYSHAACSPAPIHRRTVPSPALIHLRATTSPFPQLRTPKLGEQVVPPGRPRRNRLLEGIPHPSSTIGNRRGPAVDVPQATSYCLAAEMVPTILPPPEPPPEPPPIGERLLGMATAQPNELARGEMKWGATEEECIRMVSKRCRASDAEQEMPSKHCRASDPEQGMGSNAIASTKRHQACPLMGSTARHLEHNPFWTAQGRLEELPHYNVMTTAAYGELEWILDSKLGRHRNGAKQITWHDQLTNTTTTTTTQNQTLDQTDLQDIDRISSSRNATTRPRLERRFAQTPNRLSLELDLDNLLELTQTHDATTDEHTNAIVLPSKHRGVTPHNAFRYCWTGSRSVGCFFSQTNATTVLLTNQRNKATARHSNLPQPSAAACNWHLPLSQPLQPPCATATTLCRRSHCNPAIVSLHSFDSCLLWSLRDSTTGLATHARQRTIHVGLSTLAGGST
jgi:hypothetical protein